MRSRRRPWRDWRQMAVVTLGNLLFMKAFALQGLRVFGSCMKPSIFTGECLLGNKFLCCLRPIRRGDIIVFRSSNNPAKSCAKRVVGLAGEKVSIRNGRVPVNGVPLGEHCVVNDAHWGHAPTRVPPERCFVLGDNRAHNSDSRAWRPAPLRNGEGKLWLPYRPPCPHRPAAFRAEFLLDSALRRVEQAAGMGRMRWS